jgi:Putative antitoxin
MLLQMYGINNKPYNILHYKCHSIYDLCKMNNNHQACLKRTTISVDAKVYQRLKSQGQFGESFSELISRILEEINNKRNMDEDYK